MKIIAVGDNVVDCYIDQNLFYPGGNAVNVAVHCKRFGFDEAAYIGVFGDDIYAKHLKWALEQEKINFDRSRTIYGPSGQPKVTLSPQGDRIFLPGPQNTAQHILRLKLTPEDLHYIKTFDICHTSCYSSIEPELEKIKEACEVSYDFSDRREKEYLEQVCPFVRFAFFSGSGLTSAEIYELMECSHNLGTEIVCVTLGGDGVKFSHNRIRYSQGILPTKVVDTLGAGDSFIAGFITAYKKGSDIEESLAYATKCAAKTCTFYGGFGYPHPFPEKNA